MTPVLVASAGNTLGACTTYWLGRTASTIAPAASSRVRRASVILQRYGAPAMVLSWVPVIGDVLVILAGAARMPFWPFVAWTTAGKCARYAAVAAAILQV